MPKGGAREGAGRHAKPKIEQRADKGIATEVLAMDGPPDHVRKCDCRVCEKHPANCICVVQCGDCQKLKENCACEKYRPIKIECRICSIVADHKLCHCEVCGWWEALLGRDLRLRKETRAYLTDRRDGKPAQGVFIGDTRESALDLDFGNLVMPSAPANKVKPGAAGKPN
jgi:hypothetical protein